MSSFDQLWAYADPEGSRQRFEAHRATLDPDSSEAAEVTTQIARTYSLSGQYAQAHAQLDQIEGELDRFRPIVTIRYLLERGRTLRSAGEIEAAIPYFQRAFTLAEQEQADYHTVDAAHMMAIALPPAKQIEWAERGLAIARQSADTRTQQWVARLSNNLGWSYHDLGDYGRALELFEQASAAFEVFGTQQQQWIARWTIGRTYRSLGQIEAAIAIQKAVLAERAVSAEADGFVHEELAECYLLLGDLDKARPHFAAAYQLLSELDWLRDTESERLQRLHHLANA